MRFWIGLDGRGCEQDLMGGVMSLGERRKKLADHYALKRLAHLEVGIISPEFHIEKS